MIKGSLIIVLLTAAMPAAANDLAAGDPKVGQTLHDRDCVTCHSALVGGDGSKVYTRHDRRAKDIESLLKQIKYYNQLAGTGWFSEEELHVAAYLNQRYYKFK